MAGWASNNNQKPSVGVIMNGHDVVWKQKQPKFSQKPCMELMQNCDLPPPQKVFSGFCGVMMGREDVDDGGDYEKLELLKALRLSQTRAREAERRAESFAKERDLIASVLMKESLELFACRQWMKLLEVQVLMLQPHHRQQRRPEKEMEGDDDDCGGGGGEGVSWIVALAVCLGIAGVGDIGFGSTCQ